MASRQPATLLPLLLPLPLPHLCGGRLEQQLQRGQCQRLMLLAAAGGAAGQELGKPAPLGAGILQLQPCNAVDQPLPCLVAVAARVLQAEGGCGGRQQQLRRRRQAGEREQRRHRSGGPPHAPIALPSCFSPAARCAARFSAAAACLGARPASRRCPRGSLTAPRRPQRVSGTVYPSSRVLRDHQSSCKQRTAR